MADALTAFEIPASAVLAEKVKFDVGLLQVQRRDLVSLPKDLLDFQQNKLAQLTCLYSRLRFHMLDLQWVIGL